MTWFAKWWHAISDVSVMPRSNDPQDVALDRASPDAPTALIIATMAGSSPGRGRRSSAAAEAPCSPDTPPEFHQTGLAESRRMPRSAHTSARRQEHCPAKHPQVRPGAVLAPHRIRHRYVRAHRPRCRLRFTLRY